MSKSKRTAAPRAAVEAPQPPRYNLATCLAIAQSNERLEFPVPTAVQAVIDAADPADLAAARAVLEAALLVEPQDAGEQPEIQPGDDAGEPTPES